VPELPEVETVVRTLRPLLIGSRVSAVWTSGKSLRLRRPVDEVALASVCLRATVGSIRRRGKYILLDFPSGGLLVHLGMTGQLRVQPCDEPRPSHTHVVLGLSGRRELRFMDARRFGMVEARRDIDTHPALTLLGPDPLDELGIKELRAQLVNATVPMKAFLLDQHRIAGIGNIYASEALFRSGIHPRTPAKSVAAQSSGLLRAIRTALRVGLRSRGTTLRDYVDAEGRSGGGAGALQVYGRDGLPCRRCGTRIQRMVDAGRSTFFCPRCQPVR
jgi:formamidopyrimidine-DNA glycosylase